MKPNKESGKAIVYIIIFLLLVAIIIWGYIALTAVKTINDLLRENKKLKEAISSLTQEDQIGYAKVIKQEKVGGKLLTTIRFIESDRNNKLKKILEKEYTIEGDVIHFDALVVKFSNKMVMDGKERALYLWRRVYGETMKPSEGFPIEQEGKEPERYKDLLVKLPIKHREMFWTAIWDLANDPEKLKQHDITAIYGNVVYSKLQPGLVYIFKISNTGQVYPETVPDF